MGDGIALCRPVSLLQCFHKRNHPLLVHTQGGRQLNHQRNQFQQPNSAFVLGIGHSNDAIFLDCPYVGDSICHCLFSKQPPHHFLKIADSAFHRWKRFFQQIDTFQYTRLGWK